MAGKAEQLQTPSNQKQSTIRSDALPPIAKLSFVIGGFLVCLAFASVGQAVDRAVALDRCWVLLALYVGTIALYAIWQRYFQASRFGESALSIGLAVFLLAQSVVAIAQSVLQRDLGLWWLGERQLEAAGGYSILESGGGLWLRSYGLSPHPNILGGVLVLGVLLLLGLQFRPKFLYSLTLTLSLIALLSSFSRSACLAFAAGLTFLHFSRSEKQLPRMPLRLVATGILLLMIFQPDLIRGRLLLYESAVESHSISERQTLNRVAVELIGNHPLRGVGMSNFALAAADFLPDVEAVQPVHNGALLVSAELGLPAGLLWLAMTLLPIAIIWPHRNHCHWHQALTAALIASIVLDQFDMYFWQWPFGQIVRWLLWLVWLLTVRELPTEVGPKTD